MSLFPQPAVAVAGNPQPTQVQQQQQQPMAMNLQQPQQQQQFVPMMVPMMPMQSMQPTATGVDGQQQQQAQMMQPQPMMMMQVPQGMQPMPQMMAPMQPVGAAPTAMTMQPGAQQQGMMQQMVMMGPNGQPVPMMMAPQQPSALAQQQQQPAMVSIIPQMQPIAGGAPPAAPNQFTVNAAGSLPSSANGSLATGGTMGLGASKVPAPSSTLAQKVHLPKIRPFVDPNDKGPRQLLVNYVAKKVTEQELFELFESTVGPCECAKIILDKQTGKTKGYGFVYFATSSDAARALELLRDHELCGKKLKVSYAVPQRPCLDHLSSSGHNNGSIQSYVTANNSGHQSLHGVSVGSLGGVGTGAKMSQGSNNSAGAAGGGGQISALRGKVANAMMSEDD